MTQDGRESRSDDLPLKRRLGEFEESQAKLVQSRDRYQAVLSGLGVRACICSGDRRVEFVDAQTRAALGGHWTEERCHEALFGLEDVCPFCAHDRVMAGETVRQEIQNPKNGRWYFLVNTPIHGENGAVSNLSILADINDARLSDDASRATHEIIRTSPVVAFSWRNAPRWPVEFVTDNVEELFGYTASEFMSGSIGYADVIHPDDLERVTGEVAAASQDTEQRSFEHDPYRVVAKTGTIRQVTDKTFIRRDQNGEIAHYQGIVEEVSERERAEEAARIIRFSVDQASIGYLRAGIDACILDVNQYVCDYLGYTRDELLGMTVLDINPYISRERWKALWDEIENHGSNTIETYHRRKDGSLVPVSVTANLFVFHGRRYTISFYQDITARKKAESSLRIAEHCIRGASIGIFRVSPDGSIQDCNDTACAYYGYSRDELLRMTVSEIDSTSGEAEWEEFMRQLRETGEVSFERLHRRKDGSPLPVEILANYHEFEGQSFCNLFVLDISERLAAEAEREQLQRQLLMSQKMEAVGQMAAGIAHDFNNLLQTIAGNAELLRHDTAEDTEAFARLKHIEVASLSAGDLTRRLLAFSRKLDSQLRPEDLNALVQRVLKMMERTVPKMIRLELRAGPLDRSVAVDPLQIEQVVTNLVINAQHAMPDGGTIRIETQRAAAGPDDANLPLDGEPGEYAVLIVSDTGSGMPPETVERIFDPFFTTKDVGQGSGLGLSMVYGIIKNHHGHITCDSEVGRGTTFRIYLPLATQDSEIATSAERRRAPRGDSTETVIVVDDEPTVVEYLETILQQNGYDTLRATDGEAAIDLYLAQRDRINLIVCDLNMPGQGGAKCLAEIRRCDPAVPLLIASGLSPGAEVRRILESGPGDFIAKPFHSHDLLRKVRACLDSSSS